MTATVLQYFAIPIGIIGLLILALFLFFGIPFIMRQSIKATGELANARILEVRYGRGTVYTGGEHSNSVSSQKVILKLEVHPANGNPYVTEDRFMAKAADLLKLKPGCDMQVRFAKGNPSRVVSLPGTISASADAPMAARAGIAIANLVAQGKAAKPEEVLRALQEQGIRTRPMSQPDDPKARLEKLREMLNSGLISQQEFEAKKAEILAKM